MGGTRNGRRVTMNDAAAELGVSVEAIRKRVQRGTIESDKGPDGRRYVCLTESQDSARDQDRDAGNHGGTGALVEELRSRVRFVQRIPELEAPRKPREASDTHVPADTPTDAGGEAQEPAEPRSWWQRMFGS
jgi:hypothetical protein